MLLENCPGTMNKPAPPAIGCCAGGNCCCTCARAAGVTAGVSDRPNSTASTATIRAALT
jgi:hypothetical protein